MTQRSQRGSLSQDAVLDAALDLVDRVGLDRLTIRALARELGKPPMTLYTHFDSKRDLLDLAFGRLVQRLLKVHHRATWEEEFEDSCRHMRRVLLDHPHWVSLLTRVKVPVSALGPYDRLLGLMSKGGFRPEAAMFAFSAVMSHALGSVLVERMMGGTPPLPKRRLELVKNMLAEMPRASFPRVAAVSSKFDRWNFDDVFEVGLRSLFAGLHGAMPRLNGHRRARAMALS
jgi:AcrR family transcriptional regulator